VGNSSRAVRRRTKKEKVKKSKVVLPSLIEGERVGEWFAPFFVNILRIRELESGGEQGHPIFR